VSKTSSEPKAQSVLQHDETTLSTKEMLDAQPKRTVRIRGNASNGAIKEENYEFVCINGHNYQIMKGVDVQVPQTVYDVLVDAGVI
jgi:hypothetical protein